LTVTWTVAYQHVSGFEAELSIAGDDGRAILAKAEEIIGYLQKQGARPTGVVKSEQVVSQPGSPAEENRMVITRVRRTDGERAELFADGHKWPDLRLFEIGMLAAVGIDIAALPIGANMPCRFVAVWQHSEKLNSQGSPYKDVIRLEPAS
jgi:hypothetical protein